MTAAWVLRMATAADLDQLASIEEEGTALLRQAGVEFPAGDQLVPPEILQTCLKDGLLKLAVSLGDHPVGFLAAAERDGFLYLGEVDVAASWRRLGIGRALVSWCVSEAQRRSLKGVMLTTDRFVPFNAPFYAGCGFKVIDEKAAPPFLQSVLAEERRSGLDPERRVAMLYSF
jgi:GNAT superfamily N-acetyltransferase